MHRKPFNLLTLFAAAFTGLSATILAACSTNTVYDSYEHAPVSGWEKNDTLVFDVPRMTAAGNYRQQIGLRMTGTYPFTSISLIVEQKVIPSGRVLTDTLKCQVTDERGNFLGQGISAYQYSFDLKELTLNSGDSLHVTVRHNMKREILPGVSDIGLEMKRE